jgi:excisionase family DNA binding protein
MKNKPRETERLMTLEEISDYLQISIHTLYKMAQQDRIPAFKITNKWRFRKSEIDSWIEKNRKKDNKKR